MVHNLYIILYYRMFSFLLITTQLLSNLKISKLIYSTAHFNQIYFSYFEFFTMELTSISKLIFRIDVGNLNVSTQIIFVIKTALLFQKNDRRNTNIEYYSFRKIL